MGDDGMLLNFDLGSAPVKSRIQFKGGNWRDRKRAEKLANAGAPKASRDAPDDDLDGAQGPSKRRRVDDDDLPAAYNPNTGGENYSGGRPGYTGKQEKRQPQDPSKPAKQVVSKLFSFNPQQKTVFEDEEPEWKAPEATNAPLELANFGSLKISSRLVEELGKMRLVRPTAIQNKVVPHMMSSSGDAFVQAETGSGKTFAYLLPILHRVLLLSSKVGGQKIHRDSGLFAIIVAPTRELAKQTHIVLEQLIRPFPWLVSTAITGGESKKAEKSRIRKGVNFLVATPGRLADHIDNTKALNLGTVRWLIFDEGDRLMDLGFEEDLKKTIDALKKIQVVMRTPDGTPLDALPERRVTVLCSATMKMNVQKLGEMSLADATFLAADKGEDDTIETANKDVHKAPAQLHQSYSIVPAKLRLITLITYLKATFARRGRTMKAIIFMACADSVDFHYELLKVPAEASFGEPLPKEAELISKTVSKAAYVTSPASPEVVLHRMHGSLSQPVRTATLKSFSACKSPSVLITTDVSSRGLDIPSVDLVVEYDPAFSFSDHIHRVGRTARAGRSGDALLFLLPGTEEGYIELLKASSPPSHQTYEAILQKAFMNKMEFPVDTQAEMSEMGTSHNKAETLQLHLEQRLLADTKLLELARNGFKSHIRAYATHTREERVHFDITELHLGHTAKSFGLREAPGGIGSGLDRKSKKGGKDKGKKQDEGEARPAHHILNQKSRMLMSSAADEFNIG
ncbi:putative ATP-dependent RNA helicase DBP7 [Sarocladium strictum]